MTPPEPANGEEVIASGGGSGGGSGANGGFIPSWLPTDDAGGSPPGASGAASEEGKGMASIEELTTSDLNGANPEGEVVLDDEDDIRLPDPPKDVVRISPPNAALIDLTTPAENAPAGPPPASAAAAPPDHGPGVDLVHQAAMLSSVFEDDDDHAAAQAGVCPADAAPALAVFAPPSAQAITEPFDIQLLHPGAQPNHQQQQQQQEQKQQQHHHEFASSAAQEIVISEPAADGSVAVGTADGTTNGQLLLSPNGTLLLSMDSNLVLLNPQHQEVLATSPPQPHLQPQLASTEQDLSMPIVSTACNGKTILWSSTAAPSDWPPRTGRIRIFNPAQFVFRIGRLPHSKKCRVATPGFKDIPAGCGCNI